MTYTNTNTLELTAARMKFFSTAQGAAIKVFLHMVEHAKDGVVVLGERDGLMGLSAHTVNMVVSHLLRDGVIEGIGNSKYRLLI